MRTCLSGLLILALMLEPVSAQQPVTKLSIVIIEGEGAINNVKQRLNREPIVQVEDENRKPVAGAVVLFFLPDRGPSGVFPTGDRTLTVVTDSQGRAAARGIRYNTASGQMQIRVTASFGGVTASAAITMTNMGGAAAAGAASGGLSAKFITIIAIAAAAAAGSAVAFTRGGGTAATGPATVAPVILTPGTPGVGAPR